MTRHAVTCDILAVWLENVKGMGLPQIIRALRCPADSKGIVPVLNELTPPFEGPTFAEACAGLEKLHRGIGVCTVRLWAHGGWSLLHQTKEIADHFGPCPPGKCFLEAIEKLAKPEPTQREKDIERLRHCIFPVDTKPFTEAQVAFDRLFPREKPLDSPGPGA